MHERVQEDIMNKALKGTLVIAGLACTLPGLGLAQGAVDPRVPQTGPTPVPAPAAPSPSVPATPSTSSVAPPPSVTKVAIEQRGTVSDVWEAEVRNKDKENKVVLIETDQGQVVLADLGPSETVKVQEGTPATVTGEMVSIEGSSRFVPASIKVGSKALGPAPGNAQVKAASLGATARPQKQNVSGKVVDKEKMNAKETHIDHDLAVIEVSPGTRLLVDLGPSDQLKSVEFDEGDQLRVEGQKVQVNDRFVLIADQIQKGNQKVQIQRRALPEGRSGAKTQGLGPVPQPTKE
jgi:hypothetical protein